jgi:nucleoside-diphosphate-sugar epimerase
MSQISILGCGWLGLPLAKSLVEKGFSVKGSTTSVDKISMLESSGIQAFLLAISENSIDGKIIDFIQNSEVLVINIPPKLRGNVAENFVQKIQGIIPFIEKSTIKKVIFVSSTSVYNDSILPIETITENILPNPETESGKQLLETEMLLQSNTNFQTNIIRFGGLIGENRHPIHFLSGRKNIENPAAPINLIHQEDCIGIIEAIICHTENACAELVEVFNAVAPFHPTRQEYYTNKAKELELVLPEFEENNNQFGKLISSKKLEETLHYTFKKPQL